MASRTIQTGDDVDAALAFLGRQQNPQVGGEQLFQARVKALIDTALKEADDKRFNMVTELMSDKDKGGSIVKLRELLGV